MIASYLGEMIIVPNDEVPVIVRTPMIGITKFDKLENGLFFLGFGRVKEPNVFNSVQVEIDLEIGKKFLFVDRKFIEDYYG